MSEYDAIASQALSDDLRLTALLRCLTGQLAKHVQLMIEDDWTYDTLRALVVRYDAASSKWGSSIAATYGLAEKGGSYVNGPTDMEIDLVAKGKGKGKGKQEPKGNGKGKQDPKGKGKGKPQGGKGKDPPAQNPAANKVCHNCGKKILLVIAVPLKRCDRLVRIVLPVPIPMQGPVMLSPRQMQRRRLVQRPRFAGLRLTLMTSVRQGTKARFV